MSRGFRLEHGDAAGCAVDMGEEPLFGTEIVEVGVDFRPDGLWIESVRLGLVAGTTHRNEVQGGQAEQRELVLRRVMVYLCDRLHAAQGTSRVGCERLECVIQFAARRAAHQGLSVGLLEHRAVLMVRLLYQLAQEKRVEDPKISCLSVPVFQRHESR